jgi:hypothetical protein
LAIAVAGSVFVCMGAAVSVAVGNVNMVFIMGAIGAVVGVAGILLMRVFYRRR